MTTLRCHLLLEFPAQVELCEEEMVRRDVRSCNAELQSPFILLRIRFSTSTQRLRISRAPLREC